MVNSLQKTPLITIYFRPAGGSIVITVKGAMSMVLLNDGRFHHRDCSIRTVQRMILPELTANRSRWNNRTSLYTTMTHLMSINLLRAVPHATQFLSQVIYSLLQSLCLMNLRRNRVAQNQQIDQPDPTNTKRPVYTSKLVFSGFSSLVEQGGQ